MNVLFVQMAFFLSLLCSTHFVFANGNSQAPHLLSFHELERKVGEGEASLKEINGSIIQIRGFLYQANGGQTVLASEPNLKTCCVGSEAKRTKQLLVEGVHLPNAPSDLAVNLIGTLEIDPTGQFLFSLNNAAISESSRQNLSLWILGSLSLLAIFGLGFRLLK